MSDLMIAVASVSTQLHAGPSPKNPVHASPAPDTKVDAAELRIDELLATARSISEKIFRAHPRQESSSCSLGAASCAAPEPTPASSRLNPQGAPVPQYFPEAAHQQRCIDPAGSVAGVGGVAGFAPPPKSPPTCAPPPMSATLGSPLSHSSVTPASRLGIHLSLPDLRAMEAAFGRFDRPRAPITDLPEEAPVSLLPPTLAHSPRRTLTPQKTPRPSPSSLSPPASSLVRDPTRTGYLAAVGAPPALPMPAHSPSDSIRHVRDALDVTLTGVIRSLRQFTP